MKIKTRSLLSEFALGLAAIFLIQFNASAQPYTFSILDTLGGTLSQARGINNFGQIVGYSTSNTNTTFHATLWNGITAVSLDERPDFRSFALGINDSGQIVGRIESSAVVWHATQSVILNGLGGTPTAAVAINKNGQIVGNGNAPSGQTHALLWDSGDIIDLGVNNTPVSNASGINSAGKIVGWSWGSGGPWSRATLWDGISMIQFGELKTQATGINDAGTVVGYSYGDGNNSLRPMAWQAGTEMLPVTLGGNSGIARAINNSGRIVGYSSTVNGQPRATLWDIDQAYDLNDYIDPSSGWILTDATAINDHGWIVGTATNGSNQRAYLLSVTQVSEPTSISMLILGFILFAAFSQYRRILFHPSQCDA